MRVQVLYLLAGLCSVLATEVCNYCRPVEVQKGAGIGIDLTMAYGAVAIKFRNGTTINLVKLDGSPKYKSAMRTVAIDAKNLRAGQPSSLSESTSELLLAYSRSTHIPKYESDRLMLRPSFPFDKLSLLHAWLVQRIKGTTLASPPIKPPITDPLIVGLAGMLSELRTVIMSVEPPITHYLVLLSWPDFDADSDIYKHLFGIAYEEAGFEGFTRSQIMSWFALKHYEIHMCYDDIADPHCHGSPEEIINKVLTITYNGASLGTTISSRWLGMLWPANISENVDYGADSLLRLENPEKYWEEVKLLVAESVKGEQVDHLMILGSHTTDRKLLSVVREIFEEYGYGKAWQKYLAHMKIVASQEDLFAAARGAAAEARFGMKHGWDACLIPERCELVDDTEYEGVKTEL